MMPDDVGVLTDDADETLTRDFLRAVQTCDFPYLDPEIQNLLLGNGCILM